MKESLKISYEILNEAIMEKFSTKIMEAVCTKSIIYKAKPNTFGYLSNSKTIANLNEKKKPLRESNTAEINLR